MCETLSPKPISRKPATKLNLSQLKQQVLEHPDWYQYEHAQAFGVIQSAVRSALAKLKKLPKKTFRYSVLRVCIGEQVGSGKTALLDALCKQLRNDYQIAAITTKMPNF